MSNIRYGVLIDNEPVDLFYMHEDKDGYHYQTGDTGSKVHSFPWPLAKIPIDEGFRQKNHTYIIKTKP